MLSNLFFSLLKINAMATIVAVIVLALKYVLKKCGASRKLLFSLWIIIALRFVCPNFIESNFSLFNIFDNQISEEDQIIINNNHANITTTFIPTDIDFNTDNAITDNTVVNTETKDIQTIIPSESIVKEQSNKLEITEILMIVWIAGSSGMILYALISYLKLKKTVMFAVKGDGNYYETDMVSTPCVLGIIRPKIYLTLNLTEKEKKYILTHENTHIKRKDYFTKLIAYIILAMHWVNPISWVLFRMFVNDMEMLCDEESLKKLGKENKVGYMESLVNLASKNRKNILPCPIAFSENNTEKRVKNMIKYKKSGIIISIVALIVCIIIAAICLTNSNTLNNENNSENLYKLFNYDYALNGKSGTSLFIDSISEDEYDELVKLLYPNGIIDEQGQEIGIVDNSVEIRRNFINEHTKAYTVVDGTTKEVKLEKFYINLDELSNELYNSSFEGSNEYLFYKAKVNEDVFVFPSEWGNQPFGFIEASEDNSYYIYWYLGVWKINTDNLTIEKITSDEYNGKSYMDIRNEMNTEDGGYLVWIDSAMISPDNEYIVYRSNRGSENSSETSIWKLDLNTLVEEMVLVENLYNDIIGFASDDVIVVGSTENTRLVNLKNSNVQKIEIPQVENMTVQSVKNGKLIYRTYKDSPESKITVLNELNLETGELTELTRFEGDYSNLGNIEGISFNDMLYLQNDVDNGHYSWRMNPEDVVREYWRTLYGITKGEISDIEYSTSNEAIAYYTLNDEMYRLSLFRPIKKSNTGIWVVKDCKFHNNEVSLTYEYQLNVILNNKNLWYKDTEFEKYSYAVTDLDQNGRIEIVSSICQGTGIYTYTTIYEVNENGDRLSLCESNLTEYDFSQADIIKNNWKVFYDKFNNQYHYIFDDLTKVGMTEYYENKRDFCLSNGKISERYLVRKTTLYENEVPNITYTDFNNNVINEKEYNNFEDEYFNIYEKMMVNIEWLSNYTEIKLEDLKASYNNFIIYSIENLKVNNVSKEVYINAIKDLYYNYKLPNGTELEDPKYVDDYNMSENQFAICDVDMDGKEELLIALTHYPMAAMRTIIYDYDSNTNKFREQFTGFNWMNFYNNGSLEVMWSHNQGSAGDSLWPYTLYNYNKESDSYDVIAQVDAWDKSFYEKCYIAEIFPIEVDKDGNGIVYYVRNSGSDKDIPYDLKEYKEWRTQYILNDNLKITVPYINLTEENINNI